MTTQRLILGSQSPRRKEILGYFSYPFVQVTPDFDEDMVVFKQNPMDYAQEIALGKCQALTSLFPNDTIITADTVVYKDGKVYGKPKDVNHLHQILHELENSWHSVFTAITVSSKGQVLKEVEETKVLFNPLTEEQIKVYGEKMPWRDKAGGYMVQTAGSILVKKIDGCFYNTMGLPINALVKLLSQVGIDLWDYMRNSP